MARSGRGKGRSRGKKRTAKVGGLSQSAFVGSAMSPDADKVQRGEKTVDREADGKDPDSKSNDAAKPDAAD